MKKTLLTFIIALLAATGAWAQTTFTVNNLEYTVTDATAKTVTLTGYETAPTGALTIPATVTNEGTEYSVTGIGYEAFYRCNGITEVNIPEGVKYIITSAFEGCAALAQINLPNSLTEMSLRTFYGCTSLTEVTLPDGVTQLLSFNFYGCSALEKVTLPEGITYIGSGAFKNCSALTELTVWAITPPTLGSDAFTGVSSSLVVKVPAEGLPAYQTADIWKDFSLQGNGQAPFVVGNLKYRVTSQTENTVEVMGYQTTPTGALTIPATVTCNEVTYTVTGIKEQVFSNCSALTSVSLPDGLTSIGNAAFEYCSSLATVSIGNGLTTIGNDAFSNCTSLTGITLPDGLTTIGNTAFSNCTSLTGITIPNTVTSIGISAFEDCQALTAVTIPDGVTNIGRSAFRGCENAFTSVSIPDGVTEIGSYTFAYCYSLKRVTIGKGVTRLGVYAFGFNREYDEVTVNAVVPPALYENSFSKVFGSSKVVYVPAESLEAYRAADGWKNFTNLIAIGSGFTADNLKYEVTDKAAKTVTLTGYETAPTGALTIPATVTNEGTTYSVTTIGNSAFSNCTSLTGITLPDGLTTIGNDAFSNCTSLTGITIPNTVTSIGNDAFNACWALTQFNVDEANEAYCSDGGVLFNKDKTTLVQYPAGKAETAYIIPEGVATIIEGAFESCNRLMTVSIPSSMTTIEQRAFLYCSSLTEMTVLATTPPTVETNAFNGVSRDIPVYVPAESLAAYQEANVWNEFNLQAISTTGLPAAAMPENIAVYDGMLHNPQALEVRIFYMSGREVYRGNATNLTLPTGIYIVRCNGASGKVLF